MSNDATDIAQSQLSTRAGHHARDVPNGRDFRTARDARDARIVVVPKPLTALPSVPEPVGDDPESQAIARRLQIARREHADTIARIGEALGGDQRSVSWVSSPTARDLAGATLVVTIGGDGTFLTVARLLTDTPLFGINSSPSTSTGHYCAATAETFAARFEDVLSGAVAPTPLSRIAVSIDDVTHDTAALNDVLFAHRTPVASTRYALRVGDTSELQLSSGIWVSTASGSTAAILSAGGTIMDVADPRLQYRVREPYALAKIPPTLTNGFVEQIEIVSRSDRNALFLDGHADPIPVPFGARARLQRATLPLDAFLAFRWERPVC